ncbi:endoplasmic reticulum-resident kdel protein, putative [Cordyceps militaris CM01]|uniref:Endoplasmic reticulum-resident kdel protein, putative n=1 Tax=Cordyceps militaris (strain CM01) TaxID=983644 RepID=G3J353_CORMM|nr:endoplasmic reticulum-resident kdel protein, putative [Cordyceps militaris CM01]EGX96434.1 endoplasmic reticulum-resident kdel protein, putative [Cordyceps militaris CM01]
MPNMSQFMTSKVYPARLRLVAVLLAVAFVYAGYVLWHDAPLWERARSHLPSMAFDPMHPIRKLMIDARDEHERLLETKRTYNLQTTAARYRERRGRHPPPGFDKWVAAAVAADAVLVEDYFDRIYKDVAPFWGLDPATLAARAAAGQFVVKVRNGTVAMQGLDEDRVPWLQHWAALVTEFAEHMPDVDMPVNMMDEPRIIVPHETISALVKQEAENRQVRQLADVTTSYTGLAHVDAAEPQPYEPQWLGPDNAYWDLAVKACGPGTPAHGMPAIRDFAPPAAVPDDWRPTYAFEGYVRNWTAAIDPCEQPHLRQLHGSFVEPISISTTDELVPLFGGCKLALNNELVIPGAMYLTDEPRYSGGASHGPDWDSKRDGLVWRGVDSGGRARDNNWYHLQRHRLVEMLNGTTVARVERTGERALAFDLPPAALYPSRHRAAGQLGAWVARLADVGFTSLCFPDGCEFLRPFLREAAPVDMQQQYEYKFLPDVDGNSFSARFRSFLLSTSLPLKASVYAEWHDDRLAPWVHFVPLDNTLQDLHPVLEFFADADGPGDAAARHIAEEGKRWAEQVLRREDMRLYVWRLLLEWARVCDEKRDTLGFVGDMV